MSEASGTPRGGVIRGVGKWGMATAMVSTEIAEKFVDPESTIGAINHHVHTGTLWSFGFQLVGMGVVKTYKALKVRGSFTLSWGSDSDAPASGGHGS